MVSAPTGGNMEVYGLHENDEFFLYSGPGPFDASQYTFETYRVVGAALVNIQGAARNSNAGQYSVVNTPQAGNSSSTGGSASSGGPQPAPAPDTGGNTGGGGSTPPEPLDWIDTGANTSNGLYRLWTVDPAPAGLTDGHNLTLTTDQGTHTLTYDSDMGNWTQPYRWKRVNGAFYVDIEQGATPATVTDTGSGPATGGGDTGGTGGTGGTTPTLAAAFRVATNDISYTYTGGETITQYQINRNGTPVLSGGLPGAAGTVANFGNTLGSTDTGLVFIVKRADNSEVTRCDMTITQAPPAPVGQTYPVTYSGANAIGTNGTASGRNIMYASLPGAGIQANSRVWLTYPSGEVELTRAAYPYPDDSWLYESADAIKYVTHSDDYTQIRILNP